MWANFSYTIEVLGLTRPTAVSSDPPISPFMKIMKTTSLKLFRPTLSTVAIVILWGVSIRPAQAGYIVTLQQVGADVVATGTGAIDLTGLSFLQSGLTSPFLIPQQATIITGAAAIGEGFSSPTITGPPSFGPSSLLSLPTSSSGDIVGFSGPQLVVVPQGYASNTSLSDSSTYSGQTFTSLGVTAGTYIWTWGTGVNQNFTLVIPAAGVPDSGSTFGLFFVSLIALFGAGRFRAQRLA
jgi:hypothetical protein